LYNGVAIPPTPEEVGFLATDREDPMIILNHLSGIIMVHWFFKTE
jgi:hypothetical protein